MDRRQVLTAIASAAAVSAAGGGWPHVAQAYSVQVNSLTRTNSFPPADGSYHLGTLHAAAALHPAFAFFAALPGSFAMSPARLQLWQGQEVAAHWQALLRETGLHSIATGHIAGPPLLHARRPLSEVACFAGQRFGSEGLAATVATALGATPVTPREPLADYAEDCSVDRAMQSDRATDGLAYLWPAVTRTGSPIMLTMTASTWAYIGDRARTRIARFAAGPTDQPRARVIAPPQSGVLAVRPIPACVTRDVDRIAVGVIADLASTNALTRKLNSAFFGCRTGAGRAPA